MPDSFDAYSEYYDLLYLDKNYEEEALYVQKHLRQWAPASKSILELGCGTGKHAEIISKTGYHVTGIEVSDTMLSQAVTRARKPCSSLPGSFTPIQGDARSLDLCQTFDSVISLFHVASYQTSNEDIGRFFKAASRHLSPRGVFIFDAWYGPAVLSTPPVVRVKRMSNQVCNITRIAEPTLNTNDNTVDVHYTVLAKSSDGISHAEIHENHKMRYFFQPELKLLAEQHGLELIHSEEWLTACPPSINSWGVLFVARKTP